MDRAIKFRVWSLKNNCWCYPVLDITNDFNIKNKDSEYQYVFMQFTGLYDCEGKEIWEGDFLVMSKHSDGKPCQVTWNDGSFCCFPFGTLESAIPYCKVVGNIYENPNLLQ